MAGLVESTGRSVTVDSEVLLSTRVGKPGSTVAPRRSKKLTRWATSMHS